MSNTLEFHPVDEIVPVKKSDYVLVLCSRAGVYGSPIDVLLILKNKPAWQAGRYNLPGGKVEEGETPEQTAARELKEETGYYAVVRKFGVMRADHSVVHCFLADYSAYFYDPPKSREGETEEPLWMSLRDVMKDKRLMPNLRVIIPMLFCEIKGWEIRDDEKSNFRSNHTISVTVPTYLPSPAL